MKPRKQLEINMADKQLDACILEVVRKCHATANVQFQLKERQVTAVKSLLLREAARIFRESKITDEKSKFFFCKSEFTSTVMG